MYIILMDEATVKLHAIAMLQFSKTINLTPYAKIRLENLSKRYGNLLAKPFDNGNVKIDNLTGANSELPALDEIERLVDLGTYPKVKKTWRASLDNSNDRATGKTLWEFYHNLIDVFPDIPHGALAWATCADKGDKLGFFINQSNKLYELECK